MSPPPLAQTSLQLFRQLRDTGAGPADIRRWQDDYDVAVLLLGARLRGSGRGDLKLGVQVVTPVRLNSKETELIRQFASSRRPVPPQFSTFQQGIFAKLRDRFLNL